MRCSTSSGWLATTTAARMCRPACTQCRDGACISLSPSLSSLIFAVCCRSLPHLPLGVLAGGPGLLPAAAAKLLQQQERHFLSLQDCLQRLQDAVEGVRCGRGTPASRAAPCTDTFALLSLAAKGGCWAGVPLRSAPAYLRQATWHRSTRPALPRSWLCRAAVNSVAALVELEVGAPLLGEGPVFAALSLLTVSESRLGLGPASCLSCLDGFVVYGRLKPAAGLCCLSTPGRLGATCRACRCPAQAACCGRCWTCTWRSWG